MDFIEYQEGVLCAEDVSLVALAEQYGTPLYVYSRGCIEQRFRLFTQALQVAPEQVCYAVKANSSLAVLQVLADLGAGFDVVSGGELARVQHAGGALERVVFSGVGKTPQELHQALDGNIRFMNVESLAELDMLSAIAREHRRVVPVSLRINPDIDAATHPHITTGLKQHKFGMQPEQALAAYRHVAAAKWLAPAGIAFHIGSQIFSTEPYLKAARRIVEMVAELSVAGIELRFIDMGGGFGVALEADGMDFDVVRLGAELEGLLPGQRSRLLFEPGRFIVGPAGILLTRVLHVKENAGRHYTVVDAAMNDFLRPSMYDACHETVPVVQSSGLPPGEFRTDVVGPVCETGDFLAKSRNIVLQSGDLVAIRDAGAYGFVMSSNYNSRLRPAEVMVMNGRSDLIRKRESLAYLLEPERLLPQAGHDPAIRTHGLY